MGNRSFSPSEMENRAAAAASGFLSRLHAFTDGINGTDAIVELEQSSDETHDVSTSEREDQAAAAAGRLLARIRLNSHGGASPEPVQTVPSHCRATRVQFDMGAVEIHAII